MKNILSSAIVAIALSSLIACKPGVYLSARPGPIGAGSTTQNQNTTVMAAPVPTASEVK
ncbi:MAG: hypothetical protein K0Q74_4 [Gammaproteobacteria bacterium]|jgi:hypothetical protein|nr:hypothetical protein [Gammaproteobacteria bacterium]